MQPDDIKLHRKSAILELKYDDGGIYSLPAEFLRVNSPSAEVRGHGQGQEVLQTGKKHVKIDNIDAVGNYAIRLHFDDDHNTGIYSWEYLRELCLNQAALWDSYLMKLQKAGARRENLPDDVQIVNIMPIND
ncbi:MAG: DUF971 domain-containing protein [Gammaproteobacteria bacterium]|jgi:DUF971 family protein|nr:DUF971 domain-containing protein [Gammaproteobacteria bacterium]MBT6043413.1 DUF971 domain-containing protein [Gammaproteobacteria bacterium]